MNTMTELAISGGLGAGFQIASEVMKIGHQAVDIHKGLLAAQNKEYRENLALETKAADAAAKRSPIWLRAILAIIVFTAAFIFSHINGWTDTVTSVVTDREPWLNLFGLLRFGGGTAVKEAHGFVLTPDFWQTVRVIAFFFFGVGAARTGKRIM